MTIVQSQIRTGRSLCDKNKRWHFLIEKAETIQSPPFEVLISILTVRHYFAEDFDLVVPFTAFVSLIAFAPIGFGG